MGLGGGAFPGLTGYVTWPPAGLNVAPVQAAQVESVDGTDSTEGAEGTISVQIDTPAPHSSDVPDLVAAENIAAATWTPIEADPMSDPQGWYSELQDRVASSRAALADAGFDVDDPEVIRTLAQQSNRELEALDTESLQRVAHAAGFEHPTLVGMTGSRNPLTFWANPAYPDDHRKAAVQAAATRRHADIMAGGTYNGVTRSSLAQDEARVTGKVPVFADVSTMTRDEAQALSAGAMQALGDRTGKGMPAARDSYTAEQMATLVETYNTASSAIGADQEAESELTRLRQDLRWRLTTADRSTPMDETTRAAFMSRFDISEADANYAGSSDLVALARNDSRESWKAAGPSREAWIARWDESYATSQDRGLVSANNELTIAEAVSDPDALARNIRGLEDLRVSIQDSPEFTRPSPDAPVMATRADRVRAMSKALNDPGNVSSAVSALNEAPLENLRAAARVLGMQNEDEANRAQLRGWLAGRAFGGRNPALNGDASKWDPDVIQRSLNQRVEQRKRSQAQSGQPSARPAAPGAPKLSLDHRVRKQGKSALEIVSARNMASSKDGSRHRFQYGPDSGPPSFMEFAENPETGNLSVFAYRVNPSGSRTLISQDPDVPAEKLSAFIIDSNAKTWLVEPGVPSA